MNINRQIIADDLSKKFGLSNKICKDIIHSIFEEVINISTSQSYITITNFGKFKLVKSKTRVIHNVNSRQKITVFSKNNLKFYPAVSLKNIINNMS